MKQQQQQPGGSGESRTLSRLRKKEKAKAASSRRAPRTVGKQQHVVPVASSSLKAASPDLQQPRTLAARKASHSSRGALHPAAVRRSFLKARQQSGASKGSGAGSGGTTVAQQRLEVAKAEMHHFDALLEGGSPYHSDPFEAVRNHLSSSMATLQPQTFDVGRAATAPAVADPAAPAAPQRRFAQ